jgi:cellobiose phosphorylase
LVSGIAASREALEGLIEKYQDQAIADRCFELAWTHGLIVLRHINATETDAQLYGRLAGALLYHQPYRRALPAVIARNRRGQRNLWSFGISGDLPIVLVYSRRSDRLDLVREVVQAHAYWRLKGLAADLVILNEDDSVYRQSLHDQILTFISSGSARNCSTSRAAFLRDVSISCPPKISCCWKPSARVVLFDDKGTLAEQLQRRPRAESPARLIAMRTRQRSETPVGTAQT